MGKLLLFLSLLIFPQLLAVLLHLRLVRYSKLLALILGILSAGLVFLFLSPIFFFEGLREAQLMGEVRCGMPGLAALMMVFTGTIVELCVAAPIHVCILRRSRSTK